MLAKDIVVGGEYGFRERARPGDHLDHVRVLEKARSKWRVEWIEPNPGLVEYAASKQLVVPWKERKGFLRDERNRDRLAAASLSAWPGHQHPVCSAVDEVLEATGEHLSTGNSGLLSCELDTLERVCKRAGIEVPAHPCGYRDRFGVHHLPFESALGLAQRFAAAEPGTVITSIEAAEHADEASLRDPYERSVLLSLMNERKAAYALVRQWAGHDAALASRDEEIERLRRLIDRSIWDLRSKDADPERVARRLEYGLRGT